MEGTGVVCEIEDSVGHARSCNVDLLETKYRFVRYLERTASACKPLWIAPAEDNSESSQFE